MAEDIEHLTDRIESKHLDMGNDLDYIIGLLDEALDSDELDSDEKRAQWVIAQWCQEIGYSPDIRTLNPGELVSKDNIPVDVEKAEFQSTD